MSADQAVKGWRTGYSSISKVIVSDVIDAGNSDAIKEKFIHDPPHYLACLIHDVFVTSLDSSKYI